MTKNWFFAKNIQTGKCLARVIQREKEETQSSNKGMKQETSL